MTIDWTASSKQPCQPRAIWSASPDLTPEEFVFGSWKNILLFSRIKMSVLRCCCCWTYQTPNPFFSNIIIIMTYIGLCYSYFLSFVLFSLGTFWPSSWLRNVSHILLMLKWIKAKIELCHTTETELQHKLSPCTQEIVSQLQKMWRHAHVLFTCYCRT